MAFKRIPGISVQLKTACEELNKLTGKIGWFESAVYPDGTPVAYVATIQEFGSPEQGIPARPFMRSTAAEKEAEWKGLMAKGATAAMAGKISAKDAMEQLAGRAAGDVRRAISQLSSPALSNVTVELRRRRRSGETIIGKTVGDAAKAANSAFFKPASQSEAKPLVDTGILIASLTSVVEDQ